MSYTRNMEQRRKANIRKLSKAFVKDVYQDRIKRCIVPAKWLLQMLLVWPDSDNKSITAINCLNFINILIAEIFHAAYVIVNRKDIVNALLALATVTTTMEALVRVYILVSKKHVINYIIYTIWKKFWPVISMSFKKANHLTVQSYIRVCLTLGCFGPAIACNTIITLWPYLTSHELIFKSVYPIEWNQTYVYETLYVWQYFTEWYILIIVNIFDNFVIGIMVICVAQFVILQNIFKDILSEKSKYHRLLLFGEEICDRNMILKCLDQQKILIEICKKLDSVLNIPILIQFFNSTAALCSSCIVLKVESKQFSKMLTYAVAHMFQLFNFCHVGHELTIQSGNMADAIYSCEWERSDDTELKKAIILMIQRSQKMQIFTAAGITELNLVSYVTVLRLSFSFYTLLNSLIDRKSSVI